MERIDAVRLFDTKRRHGAGRARRCRADCREARNIPNMIELLAEPPFPIAAAFTVRVQGIDNIFFISIQAAVGVIPIAEGIRHHASEAVVDPAIAILLMGDVPNIRGPESAAPTHIAVRNRAGSAPESQYQCHRVVTLVCVDAREIASLFLRGETMRLDIYRRAEQGGRYSYLAVPATRRIPEEANAIDWETMQRGVDFDDAEDALNEYLIENPTEQINTKGYAITSVKRLGVRGYSDFASR